MSDWDIGDVVTISAVFRDAAGALADPTTTTLTVMAPDGTLSTPTPVKDSTGTYHADVPVTASGSWAYRWLGTGAVAAAEEGTFSVRRRRVPEVVP